MDECPRCGSSRFVKNGFKNGRQRHICQDCGYQVTEGGRRRGKQLTAIPTQCPHCSSKRTVKNGQGRRLCRGCGKTFKEPKEDSGQR
jgi:transposase-like protein